MIVCSSSFFFIRISRYWLINNSSSLLSLTHQFKRYHSQHGLNNIYQQSGLKGLNCRMGWNKKRKTVNPVWRPINTQSEPQDCFVESVMAEPGCTGSIDQAADVGPKDTEGVSGDCMTASTSENRSEDVDDKQSVSIEVGASLMRFIRGKDGSVQKGIEDEMGVKLKFPLSKKDDSIVIEGDSMDKITKATEKIQVIINEAVNSPALEYSHFISLPLAIHPELVDKLTRFQSTILGDCHSKGKDGTIIDISTKKTSEGEESGDITEQAADAVVKLKVAHADDAKLGVTDLPIVSYLPKGSRSKSMSDKGTEHSLGIEKSIFNKPKTFHLTVLMLKLWNKERIQAAKGVLQSVTSELIEALDNRPLFVRLKGLACMKGSPAKAQVLYLPVEEVGNEGRLLCACQIIIDAYVKAGLVLEKDTHHKLKLHATVMNTVLRKGRRSNKRFKKDTFDARGIFEQFGSELWGDYHIREAHLSKRFLYDENGYYHCCASIPFPKVSEVPEPNAIQVESTEVTVEESVLSFNGV